MKYIKLIALIIVAAASGFIGANFAKQDAVLNSKKETAYERVMRTGILRCGYATFNPIVYKDLKSGEMKGLFVEFLEEIAKNSDIKIDWSAEVGFGQVPQALKSNKIDAFCAGMWNDSGRGKVLGFTTPLILMNADIYTKNNDKRFPANKIYKIADINKAKYRTSYAEGDVLEFMTKSELPNVEGVLLNPLASLSDNIQNLLTGKNDFLIMPSIAATLYERSSGKNELQRLNLEIPLRTYGDILAVSIHEHELRLFLNTAITELVNSGSYHRIFNKYSEQYPGAFIPVK